MADESAPRESPAAPIGRVRLSEPLVTVPGDGEGASPAESGWSIAGAGIALLIILVMVGALVIILWAVFQTRA